MGRSYLLMTEGKRFYRNSPLVSPGAVKWNGDSILVYQPMGDGVWLQVDELTNLRRVNGQLFGDTERDYGLRFEMAVTTTDIRGDTEGNVIDSCLIVFAQLVKSPFYDRLN